MFNQLAFARAWRDGATSVFATGTLRTNHHMVTKVGQGAPIPNSGEFLNMRIFSKILVGALVVTAPLISIACGDAGSNTGDGDGDGDGGKNGDGDGDGSGGKTGDGDGDGDGDGSGGNTGDGDGDGDGGKNGDGDGDGDGDDEPPFGYADCEHEDGPNRAVLKSGVGAFRESSDWMNGWTNWSINSTPEDKGEAPTEILSGVLDTMELDADTVYGLDGYVYVPKGATLTIPAGTLFKSEGKATLIISRGGKLIAEGTKSAPIVFTSTAKNGSKTAQQWGGIVLLGRDQNFKGSNTTVEGIDAAEGLINVAYGCDPKADADDLSDTSAPIFKCDADDSSGSLKYVRIEFGGVDLAVDNEINGLTMGSVGAGTKLSYVQVNTNFDDGFEWFGGSVNGDHLVVNNAGDDSFDIDQGYTGELNTIFSRQITPTKSDPNGFEWDSDLGGKTPVTFATAKHATICGVPGKPNFGAVLRENITGVIDDAVFVGFDAAFDTRNAFTSANIKITRSMSWDHTEGLAMDESAACADAVTVECDNDEGFDEAAWFSEDDGNLSYDE